MKTKLKLPKYKNHQLMPHAKNLFAILIVKFTFYLVISIIYCWILVLLDFRQDFDWNLTALIAISLLIFSMLFERPVQMVRTQ